MAGTISWEGMLICVLTMANNYVSKYNIYEHVTELFHLIASYRDDCLLDLQKRETNYENRGGPL